MLGYYDAREPRQARVEGVHVSEVRRCTLRKPTARTIHIDQSEWGVLLGYVAHDGRKCYHVVIEGRTEYWPVGAGGYEFR
jgi:hypothetical protein